LASTTTLRPSGVSSARLASCAASASRASAAGGGPERGRLAVAERDGAGLVEQEYVDVAGGLDRTAARGDDIRLDHPVHARDADGAE
jgi:hypothetical protein